jgi:hypothetical protein
MFVKEGTTVHRSTNLPHQRFYVRDKSESIMGKMYAFVQNVIDHYN